MILSANDCLVLPQWPALVGKETTSPREFILYNVDDCFSDYRGAIRVGHWKYIQDVNLSHWAVPTTDTPPMHHVSEIEMQNFVSGLYNVEEDPTESVDLSARYPEKLEELQGILDAWKDKSVIGLDCNADVPLAYEMWQAHDHYVVPWSKNPDYMYECSLASSCADSSLPQSLPELERVLL